jgi:hypothetical protein
VEAPFFFAKNRYFLQVFGDSADLFQLERAAFGTVYKI